MTSCGNNKICVLGGRGQPFTSVLDTSTLTWANGARPPVEMNHFQAVTGPDGCAWVLGAWTGKFPDEIAVEEMYRYCAEEDKWEVTGKIPRPRGAGGALVYDGAIYLVSGNVGGHNPSATLVNWFDRYDLETKEWSVMENIPNRKLFLLPFSQAIIYAKAVVLSTRLYVYHCGANKTLRLSSSSPELWICVVLWYCSDFLKLVNYSS